MRQGAKESKGTSSLRRYRRSPAIGSRRRRAPSDDMHGRRSSFIPSPPPHHHHLLWTRRPHTDRTPTKLPDGAEGRRRGGGGGGQLLLRPTNAAAANKTLLVHDGCNKFDNLFATSFDTLSHLSPPKSILIEMKSFKHNLKSRRRRRPKATATSWPVFVVYNQRVRIPRFRAPVYICECRKSKKSPARSRSSDGSLPLFTRARKGRKKEEETVEGGRRSARGGLYVWQGGAKQEQDERDPAAV